MFIFSVKADRRKICVILAVVLLVITSVIVLFKVRTSPPTAVCAGEKYSLSAATNEERVAFFSQFGWKVNAEPVETKEIVIPEKFNDVYNSYNKIQKDQGLDLTPYAGKTCKQWVYLVTNYPQTPEVRGTILVYGNRVIGGDLSTAALDGFMTGFRGELPSDDTMKRVPSSSAAKAASSAAPKASSSAGVSSGPVASKPSKPAKKSAPSAVEAKPKSSSAVAANAWPTD